MRIARPKPRIRKTESAACVTTSPYKRNLQYKNWDIVDIDKNMIVKLKVGIGTRRHTVALVKVGIGTRRNKVALVKDQCILDGM